MSDRPSKRTKRLEPVTLAHTYKPEKHAKKIKDGTWCYSEKLDGIRAYFDVEKNKLFSRNNKEINAPQAWLDELESLGLSVDGELFMGRGKFQDCIKIVRKTVNPDYAAWSQISFQIFDIRDPTQNFQERYNKLCETIPPDHPFLQKVKQTIIQPTTNVEQILNTVVQNKGEGLMVRSLNQYYEHKRSHSILKLKTFKQAEGIITELVPGKGKHKGRMGAVMVRNGDKVFKVGSGFSDKQRDNPPVLGSIITYQYFESTDSGLPRFPTFIAIRDYE